MNTSNRMTLILILWVVFIGLVETAYFGWNASPGSDAELIADVIIACTMVLLLAIRVE